MRDIQYPGRSVVMCAKGMVATSQPMATQVGLDILKRGGNAMDAAIAASATLCVTEPQSTGIGGDCFILYHEARNGKLHGYNGSGRAPGRATLEEFKARGHTEMPERGILSVSVPGAIEGWETALERFGTMSFADVLQPAIDFAENGYAVSPVVAKFWKRNEAMLASSVAARDTLLVDGKAPFAGSLHRQPNLAKSMRLIAQDGKQAFYSGWIAEEIVRYSREQDGLLELDDLAEHQGEWVEPIYTDYRGLRLYEIPPNSQGITALMALNILENTNLGEMEHLSVDYIHTFVEAYKLACAERDRHVGDPDFSNVPLAAMLSKSFAADQYGRIDPAQAGGYPLGSNLPEHKDTIYLTVVDKDRNAVSFINSLYMNYGSGMVAGDTGITLQNRGAGFVLEEDHPNCITPGKRPFHTISPAMAYRGGNPILSFGIMGGFYQPMGHSYVFSNWLDFGMDLQEAIDAPRFLPHRGVLTVERPIPQETREALEKRGHVIAEAEVPQGGGQAIYIDSESGVLQAASDPRKDGCAMGY
ncbi:MAG: gamma-glutamyltransferase [SAR324 cluster bacterium]|nr:gamma-glutamyltransferase [SAR324 cluster bacterium]